MKLIFQGNLSDQIFTVVKDKFALRFSRLNFPRGLESLHQFKGHSRTVPQLKQNIAKMYLLGILNSILKAMNSLYTLSPQ